MTSFTDADRLARMTEWVKTIEAEVGDVLLQHHIFWQVQDIIRGNPHLANARSHFFEWMGDVFVASAAVAVRRQVDNHDDSICLRRLLREAKDYAQIVTRSFYLSLCCTPGTEPFLKELNDHTFDEWAGSDGQHIDAAMVESDLRQLIDTCQTIQHYATKRVAHYDKHGVTPQKMPTFEDLDKAYKVIESLTQKYYLMFTGVWIAHVQPTIAYPWTDIFTLPWIPARSREVH
jgi:hypothetical protein